MQAMRETNSGCTSQIQRTGEFFKKLTPSALRDLESMEFPTSYQPGVLLFSEKTASSGLFIILSGEVKLSIKRWQASHSQHRQGRRDSRTIVGSLRTSQRDDG